MAGAPQGQGEEQRTQKNAERVIPIKKLETIVLDALKVLAQDPQQIALVIVINNAIV